MRYTVEEHPRTIDRYAHVAPARGWKVRACGARCPRSRRTCTRQEGHRGPHVAHRFFRRVVAVWDSGPPPPTSRGAEAQRARRDPARRPIGLRQPTPSGALRALRNLVAGAMSSVEEIALLVFFLAFVWFAIDWLLIILG